MSQQFETFLRRLEKRVAYIRGNLDNMSKGVLKRELTSCNSFLSTIEHYALKEGIDLAYYDDRIATIHDGLVEIQAEVLRQPFLMKLFGFVRKIIKVLCDLVGLPSLGDLLGPGYNDPPLLLR